LNQQVPETPSRASATPGLIGAVELKTSQDDAPPAPPPRAEPPSAPRSSPPRRPDSSPDWPPPRSVVRDSDRRRRYEAEEDEDHPRRGRDRYDEPRRLDLEPHRGGLVMTLGIISLVCVALFFLWVVPPVVGLGLGLTAWIMGHIDLRKIKNRKMDEDGLGGTQAGWICGIIGSILNLLVIVSCLGFCMTMIIYSNNAGPTTPKTGFGQPSSSSP
jgi:hypothetical protein